MEEFEDHHVLTMRYLGERTHLYPTAEISLLELVDDAIENYAVTLRHELEHWRE